MRRTTRRRLARAAAALMLSACPALAQHAAYLDGLQPWIAAHPVKAVEVIASGRAWCEWCGDAYRLDRLAWCEVDGTERLTCNHCYKYLLTICD